MEGEGKAAREAHMMRIGKGSETRRIDGGIEQRERIAWQTGLSTSSFQTNVRPQSDVSLRRTAPQRDRGDRICVLLFEQRRRLDHIRRGDIRDAQKVRQGF